MLVSALDVKPDGTKSDRWGPNPKGIFIFDANGRFAQFITGGKQSVLAGFVAGFGTLSTIAAISQSDSAAL
jgi:hypothetical protein